MELASIYMTSLKASADRVTAKFLVATWIIQYTTCDNNDGC